MELSIVDVFAESPFAGNQLAVVRGAAALAPDAMQRIAHEMNYSETTFVTAESKGRATVRIFTPNQELPFAGHPTLGTAWLLAGGRGRVTLELGVGDVTVWFERGIAWMQPPATKALGSAGAHEAAARIGLTAADLAADFEPVILECGPQFTVIGVNGLGALRRARAPAPPSEPGIGNAPFVVCRGGYHADSDFAARMFFFDGAAMREDPATGSANSAFAYLLSTLGYRGRLTVDQGYEIGRPSRIYLDLGDRTAVGGKVQLIAEGRLMQAPTS
jgi:trans-2,3-dihydro-3-hydroxyanthranilate isomerase